MTDHREHVSFEVINDFVDGRVDNPTAARISEHLGACVQCRSEHDNLRQLLAVASTAQRSVDPGEDLWADIRREIDRGKEVALRPTTDAPNVRPSKRSLHVSPFILAAAAILLIVLSSGITTIVLRKPTVSIVDSRNTTNAPSAVLPASFRVTEDEYSRTIRELRIAVEAQRANLSPETVRTVDHSLAVVDSAIAEARAALIADPNNRTLVDLLASSYQRKLDLLRRTSELSSKI